jgi:hypothetical protein
MKSTFNDTIKVHSTRSGSQFVNPSDIFRSEQFRRDCDALRRLRERMEAEAVSMPPEIAAAIDDGFREMYEPID